MCMCIYIYICVCVCVCVCDERKRIYNFNEFMCHTIIRGLEKTVFFPKIGICTYQTA